MADQHIGTNREERRVRLTRLIQHVALNKSGWWEWALERLTLACAHLLNSSTREQLCQIVQDSSGLSATSSRLLSTVSKLVDDGKLVEVDNLLHVAEAVRIDLIRYEESTITDEKETYQQFKTLVQAQGLEDRSMELWTVLQDEVVVPLIESMGARTYGLIHPTALDDTTTIEAMITDLVQRHGEDVRALFGEFLDPTNTHVRRFVLRRLNAQYALSAAALPLNDLDRLAQLNAKPTRIDIFLDTNFLLSVLGLHDNPSDTVALQLLSLVKDLRSRVPLKLYVLPITVEETRKVIRNITFELGEFGGQRNLAAAASRITSQGLVQRYLEAVCQSPTTLTPDDFFDPYDGGLLPLLRSKDIELYNTNLDQLRISPKVIDDIHLQDSLQQRYRQRGPKPYEANLHDMVLWHFANDRRSSIPLLPLEVPSWVVTIDYGFLSFDRNKRIENENMPVCLHPTTLIDLYQFWVPSTTTLDEALVGGIRQPLLFLDFDVGSEQITLRILSQISRYGNAQNINPEAASAILTNNALRERIEKANPDRSEDELIVDRHLPDVVQALGEEVESLRQDLTIVASKDKELEGLAISVEEGRTLYEEERALHECTAAALARERARATQSTRTIAALREVESRLKGLQKEKERDRRERDEAESRRVENRRIGVGGSITAIVAAVVVVGGVRLASWLLSGPAAYLIAVWCSLLMVLVGAEATLRCTRYGKSRYVKWIRRIRGKWWTAIGSVLVGVVASWLVEELGL